MEFELTAEQREYRDRARAVATERLLPGYQERERAGRIEPELRARARRAGADRPGDPGGAGRPRR